jgi:hypothetical protein
MSAVSAVSVEVAPVDQGKESRNGMRRGCEMQERGRQENPGYTRQLVGADMADINKGTNAWQP